MTSTALQQASKNKGMQQGIEISRRKKMEGM